jgi:predicted esterase
VRSPIGTLVLIFFAGCVVGLATGLTTERKLAGIVALSGYLAMPKKIASLATELGKSSPIFWGHGESDDVVKFSWAERSRDVLEKELQVKSLEFHSYRGVQHSASMEELSDLKAWLEKVLPAEAS